MTITAANQEEMLQRSSLDRLHDLISHTQYRMMSKTNHDLLFRNLFRKAPCIKSSFDDRCKIKPLYMSDAGISNQTTGEDAPAITDSRTLDTIGRHQNRSRKCIKFCLLILPGTTIISNQMSEFF